jgi:hypothetical protein
MEAICSSETLVPLIRATWHHIQDGDDMFAEALVILTRATRRNIQDGGDMFLRNVGSSY